LVVAKKDCVNLFIKEKQAATPPTVHRTLARTQCDHCKAALYDAMRTV